MALMTFPISPLPAAERVFNFNENIMRYDSGARQATSAWRRPLYRWTFNFQNINEVTQGTLTTFVRSTFGRRSPFLMKDPYDYLGYPNIIVNTNATNATTLQVFDVNSFKMRVDTNDISTITSNLSGFVSLGSEFSYNVDDGVFTINTIDAADYWTIGTVSYWRKVAFANVYTEQSRLWNSFNTQVIMEEIV